MFTYVFIDSRVSTIENLQAGIAPDAAVVLLDPLQDGLAQIAQALAGVTDLDAIHIVSHGAQGALYLGDAVLTGDNLALYTSELSAISVALSSEGDILLYGCDVAKGVAGKVFIDQLASYTGADVAASTDATGSAALGGNWVLESNTGVLEAQAVSPGSFDTLLAAPTLTAAGTLDRSFDIDGKVTTVFISGQDDRVNSVALQADGKIVAAGVSSGVTYAFALARYNADGSLDTSFDGDGRVTTGNGSSNSMVLQADGKIVVAGSSVQNVTPSTFAYDFELVRYNTNGSPDATFDGDGRVTTAIGAGNDSINSMVLQADG